MTRKSSAVGMRNAVLRNNLKWREAAEQAMKRGRNFFYFVVVNLDLLCTLVLLICDVYIRTGDGYVASKIFKLIEIKSDPTVDLGNCRLDFRRSLVSGLPTMHSREERGLISRKAAGNRA